MRSMPVGRLRQGPGRSLRARRPRVEPLEDRALLSLLSGLDPAAVPRATPDVLTPGMPSGHAIGLTPQQLRAAYGFGDVSFGQGIRGDGTGQTIAIVVAYHRPDGLPLADLQQFDQAFSLPDPPQFHVFTDPGAPPAPPVGTTVSDPAMANWGLEAALDVEWAHALAPGANILLAEAHSSALADLMQMVEYAREQPGVSVVSMSWGSPEVASEVNYDGLLTTPAHHIGMTFLAATGDHAGQGVQYPAASPNVLAVGGTTLATDAQGHYLGEQAWPDGQGGLSQFERYKALPSHLQGVVKVPNPDLARATPDVSLDAGTPVAIYDSYDFGSTTPWVMDGGTSLATPAWAALVAIADQGTTLMGQGTLDGGNTTTGFAGSTAQKLYQAAGGTTALRDVTDGSNGNPAGPKYDLATGLGTPTADELVLDQSGNVGVPIPTSPVGLTSASTPPIFSWSPVPGARDYHLIVKDVTASPFVAVDQPHLASTTYLSSFNANHSYTWTVQAEDDYGTTGDVSNPATFTATTQAGPYLIVPPGGLASAYPTFTWAAVPGAVSYDLKVQSLIRGGGISGTVISLTHYAGTSYVPTSPLSLTSPYGYLVSINANLPSGASGGTYTNLVPLTPFGATALQWPVADATEFSNTPTLSWSPSPGATAYLVSIVDVAHPNLYSALARVVGTSYAPTPELTAGETYSWSVTPTDETGSVGSTSGARQFTVLASTGISGSLAAPTPAAVARPASTKPTFSWSSVPGATGYELGLFASTEASIEQINVSGGLVTPGSFTSASDHLDVFAVTGTSFTPPAALNYGDYYRWWVRAVDGSGDVSPLPTPLYFQAPLLQTSPADGEPVNAYQPTFQWKAVSGSPTYELSVFDTGDQSEVLDVQDLAVTSYRMPVPLLNNRTYTWSVVATTTSYGTPSAGGFAITTARTPPVQTQFTVAVAGGGLGNLAAPVALYPSGAINSNLPRFTWSGVPNATGYALSIQSMKPGVQPLQPIPVSTTAYTLTTPLDVQYPYLWWVTAYDNQGDLGPASTALAFMNPYSSGSGGAPTNLMPGGLIPQTDPTYSWAAGSGATQYALTVVNLTRGVAVLTDTLVAGTFYTGPALVNGDMYEFFVFNNSQGASRTFTVGAPVIGTPTTISPANGAKINSTTPTLNWTPVNGASGYLLFLYDETAAANVLTGVPIPRPSYTPHPPLLVGHTYRWVVEAQVAVNGQLVAGPPSAQAEFTSIHLVPPNEDPFSGPVNTSTPTLTWSSVAGASYYYVSARDPATNAPLLPPTRVEATSAPKVSFTPSAPILTAAGGSFQWFVYAYDDAGDFRVQSSASPVPINIYLGTPSLLAYGQKPAGRSPTLSWRPVPGAVRYQLSYADEADHPKDPKDYTSVAVAQTSFAFAAPLKYGHFYDWYVTAFDAAGNASRGASADTFQTATLYATKLAVVSPPPTQIAPGTTFSLTVAVEDPSGQTSSAEDGSQVQLAMAGGGLGGTLTAMISHGQATFPGLSINRVGTGFILQASLPGLAGASSPAVSVTTAPVGFDERYYLTTYPNVAAAVRSGVVSSGWDHYVRYGQSQGYNPSPYYNEAYYLAANPAVAAMAGPGRMFSSGFFHFLQYGQYEGRDPSPYFNAAFYLASNPDVASAVQGGMMVGGVRLSAFGHYLLIGQHQQGRNPTPVFDEAYYLAQDPNVAAAVASGMFDSGYEHFILHGQHDGHAPSPLYDEAYYLSSNPDVAVAVASGQFASGYEHFLHYGLAEGRIPLTVANWNEANYLATYHDVAVAVQQRKMASGFAHYVLYGQSEGRLGGLLH